MTFIDRYEDEDGLVHSIAYALQQSGALERKDRMDEPQHRVARRVIEHLKRCGYTITPSGAVAPPSVPGRAQPERGN